MKTFILSFLLSLLLLSNSLAQTSNLNLTSPAFKDNQEIPLKYTCNGSNINPPLNILNVPSSTKSLVLLIHEVDAPAGDWIHWMVYNIRPNTRIIGENSIPGYEIINDFNKFGYGGPCPTDEKTHHYIFDLFAIDTIYTLNANGSVYGLLKRIEGHVVAKTRLVGTYKNSP